jgi:hypothetical protein
VVLLSNILAGGRSLVFRDLARSFILQQCGGEGVIDATSTLKLARGFIGFRRMDRSARVKEVPAFLIWVFLFEGFGSRSLFKFLHTLSLQGCGRWQQLPGTKICGGRLSGFQCRRRGGINDIEHLVGKEPLLKWNTKLPTSKDRLPTSMRW